jgi:D-cysteine desulfhydrase family pyridoxal phosphate-dependent enzyme
MSTAQPQYLQTTDYKPPEFAKHLSLVPKRRVHLAVGLPTPIHPWRVPGLPEGIDLWIKRDDLTGMQLSGNKVRKLEFLMAEVQAQGHDSVITIGGIQSNHCRATAVAAKFLGLDAHLILRNSRTLADGDPGLIGNLLPGRMAGAHIWQVTKEEYQRVGSVKLCQQLEAQLRAQGRNPYVIAVGGSTPLGTWGYVEAAKELLDQVEGQGFSRVAVACGSGGTTAGLALGFHLSGSGLPLSSYGVCDSPEIFYADIDSLFSSLGHDTSGGAGAADILTAHQAKGIGYAMSTEAELQFTVDVAQHTGIILDPVYSGKAVYNMVQQMREDPNAWRGGKVLFVHTGGLLGTYDKASQLQPLLEAQDRAHRLQVPQD